LSEVSPAIKPPVADFTFGQKRIPSDMKADVAEVVMKLVTVNAAVAVVMVPLAFLASALALSGLEKLERWWRHQSEKRPLISPDNPV
jgi:hypothetical protein